MADARPPVMAPTPTARTRRRIPEATVARLPLYLRSLLEAQHSGDATISSERLAELAGVNAAKVRKDLSYLGSYGTRGVGYDVEYLLFQMSRELGLTQDWPVAIVGLGNLGHALANYGAFGERGFPIVALFDADARVVGSEVRGVPVRHVDDLPEVAAELSLAIGIIATPAAAAQDVADRLVAAGVSSVLNFAPTVIAVPDEVSLRKVDLAVELQILASTSSADPAAPGCPSSRRRTAGRPTDVAVAARPYPVVLLLEGRRVLVVGGGAVAVGKVEGLVAAGAIVHVVAREVSAGVKALPVTWEERGYRVGEVAGYRFVVTCTDDPEVNAQVFRDGEEAGIFVNAADDPRHCSATLPARFDRGPLLVMVSTSGHSPALAGWLRDRLGEVVGPEYETLVELLAEARAELASRGLSRPVADWRSALDSGMLDDLRAGRVTEAREQLRRRLHLVEGSDSERP